MAKVPDYSQKKINPQPYYKISRIRKVSLCFCSAACQVMVASCIQDNRWILENLWRSRIGCKRNETTSVGVKSLRTFPLAWGSKCMTEMEKKKKRKENKGALCCQNWDWKLPFIAKQACTRGASTLTKRAGNHCHQLFWIRPAPGSGDVGGFCSTRHDELRYQLQQQLLWPKFRSSVASCCDSTSVFFVIIPAKLNTCGVFKKMYARKC